MVSRASLKPPSCRTRILVSNVSSLPKVRFNKGEPQTRTANLAHPQPTLNPSPTQSNTMPTGRNAEPTPDCRRPGRLLTRALAWLVAATFCALASTARAAEGAGLYPVRRAPPGTSRDLWLTRAHDQPWADFGDEPGLWVDLRPTQAFDPVCSALRCRAEPVSGGWLDACPAFDALDGGNQPSVPTLAGTWAVCLHAHEALAVDPALEAWLEYVLWQVPVGPRGIDVVALPWDWDVACDEHAAAAVRRRLARDPGGKDLVAASLMWHALGQAVLEHLEARPAVASAAPPPGLEPWVRCVALRQARWRHPALSPTFEAGAPRTMAYWNWLRSLPHPERLVTLELHGLRLGDVAASLDERRRPDEAAPAMPGLVRLWLGCGGVSGSEGSTARLLGALAGAALRELGLWGSAAFTAPDALLAAYPGLRRLALRGPLESTTGTLDLSSPVLERLVLEAMPAETSLTLGHPLRLPRATHLELRRLALPRDGTGAPLLEAPALRRLVWVGTTAPAQPGVPVSRLLGGLHQLQHARVADLGLVVDLGRVVLPELRTLLLRRIALSEVEEHPTAAGLAALSSAAGLPALERLTLPCLSETQDALHVVHQPSRRLEHVECR